VNFVDFYDNQPMIGVVVRYLIKDSEMKKSIGICLLVMVFMPGCKGDATEDANSQANTANTEYGVWQSLFNGKDLTGWKASEHKGSFHVEDGMIVANGRRSHLFYVGPVANHRFKNFEFMASVKTTPGSNSGIYFHTAYQQKGWPAKGYESQVNISHSDPQKSGGLYDAAKVNPAPAEDNKWYSQHIIVKSKHVTVKIDGKTVVDYMEPPDVNFKGWPGRRLSSGTFAIQAHDPKSLVYFKDIKVKVLQ